MNWTPIIVAGLHFERMIGFSLPVRQVMVLITYEGIHVVDVDAPALIETNSAYPEGGNLYDRADQKLQYGGATYTILGVFGGAPTLHNAHGESVQLDRQREVLRVENPRRGEAIEFPYEDLSGDWAYATFSDDGGLILLGMPYDLYLFRRG